MIRCVYIGNKFYRESKTIMSSIYIDRGNTFTRTDWGKIQIALERGEFVEIRPATPTEIKMFEEKLTQLNEDLKDI